MHSKLAEETVQELVSVGPDVDEVVHAGLPVRLDLGFGVAGQDDPGSRGERPVRLDEGGDALRVPLPRAAAPVAAGAAAAAAGSA